MPTPRCITISAAMCLGVVGHAAAADLPCWDADRQAICREDPHEPPGQPEVDDAGEAEADSPEVAAEPEYEPQYDSEYASQYGPVYEPFAIPAFPANGSLGRGDAALSGVVRTSRSFLGPHEFPPEQFAAYGIVVFPARATEATRQRHLAACEAYVATLPTPSELFIPEDEQMVTAWPVDDEDLAANLTDRPDVLVCETAVARYDLTTGLTALGHARAAADLSLQGRRGPFLLAWSPSSDKGSADALVLFADLSTAVTYAHFEDYFLQWREDIERSPELWENGWSVALVRDRIRDWADELGAGLFGR